MPHRDPEEYHELHKPPQDRTKAIVLWSISGLATLTTYTDGNWPTPWNCEPHTALMLPAHLTHKVSPPDPEWGTRVLLFFGQRG